MEHGASKEPNTYKRGTVGLYGAYDPQSDSKPEPSHRDGVSIRTR